MGRNIQEKMCLTLLIINDVQDKIRRDLCHLPDGPERRVWTGHWLARVSAPQEMWGL